MMLVLLAFIYLWATVIVLTLTWFGIHSYYAQDFDKKVDAAARAVLAAPLGKTEEEIKQLVKDQAQIVRESKLPLSWFFLPGR
jgi:cell division protein FtsB